MLNGSCDFVMADIGNEARFLSLGKQVRRNGFHCQVTTVNQQVLQIEIQQYKNN